MSLFDSDRDISHREKIDLAQVHPGERGALLHANRQRTNSLTTIIAGLNNPQGRGEALNLKVPGVSATFGYYIEVLEAERQILNP